MNPDPTVVRIGANVTNAAFRECASPLHDTDIAKLREKQSGGHLPSLHPVEFTVDWLSCSAVWR